MIGITVFSDIIMIFSTLKHFGNMSHVARSKKSFQCRVMTQTDKFESTNLADHMIGQYAIVMSPIVRY